MSRGLTDPIPEPIEDQDKDRDQELDDVIRSLIIGQNKLHDRLVDLERKLDHSDYKPESNPVKKRPWKNGL
nr:MAG TPA: hypothetical protein [Caudoviricetes sp.]